MCECRFVVVLRYAKYWNATGFEGIVSIRSHCFIRGQESLSGCSVVQNSKALLWTSVFLTLCIYIFNDCFQVAAFLDKGEAWNYLTISRLVFRFVNTVYSGMPIHIPSRMLARCGKTLRNGPTGTAFQVANHQVKWTYKNLLKTHTGWHHPGIEKSFRRCRRANTGNGTGGLFTVKLPLMNVSYVSNQPHVGSQHVPEASPTQVNLCSE